MNDLTHDDALETAAPARFFTISEVMSRYQVGRKTVQSWIDAGDLPVIDVSRPGSAHRAHRISPEALAAFENRRKIQQARPLRKKPFSHLD